MASVLDSVKHYQHSIEKYANDEQKVLKCIDKLYNLDVTVQHLQETGVGRTVNALRKEPGGVGQAARALVYKWKTMVAAEESDQEEHKTDTSNYNGHENEKYYENSSESRSKYEKPEKSYKAPKNEEKPHKDANGDYGSKRKYQSSEEEEPEVKKSRYPSTKDNGYKVKTEVKVKQEPSESEMDSQDDSSQSDSESDSQSSEEDRKPDIKVLQDAISKTEGQSLKKHSSSSSRDKHKHDSYSDHSKNNAEKHHRNHTSDEKYSSEKSSSKEKSHSAHSHKSSKEYEKSNIKKEKEHRPHESEKKHRSESSSKHSDKHRSSQSSDKQKNSNSSSDKHRSSSNSDKQKSSDEKHRSSSNSDKHTSSSISEKQKPSTAEKHKHHAEKHTSSKTDREKQKHSSEKEISSDRHKTKEKSSSSSSKDKQASSSKEKSKDKSSSSKTKEDNHKSVKSHSSSKSNDDKRKSESSHHEKSSKKSKHKSNSSKSGSSRSKHEERKKNDDENVDDGIDCGSGASFAEALGMISPTKPKKKSVIKDILSPNANDDMSPAALLAPTAKLAPLPALEISALPEISPNYRPRPPPKFLPHFTDDEAMNAGLSSKNQRTKVYSGNKVIGKIPTLYEMCVHILQEHIDSLEYTGGVPYDILKPVVDRATPQQLFVLEHYNPYLMEETDHLWQKFCEKSFRSKKRQEMETWREMYMRCQEEQEIKLKSLTANIRIAQEAKKAPIKQTKMAYVDCVVKPPRNIAKKQAQHGTAFATAASPAARVASLAVAPNVLKGGRPTPVPTVSTSSSKPKKAPLMQKALQFLRGRKR